MTVPRRASAGITAKMDLTDRGQRQRVRRAEQFGEPFLDLWVQPWAA